MIIRVRVLLSLVVVFGMFAWLVAANDKKKETLPAEVLAAQTVVVLVDPDAGMSTSAPLANRTAQEDVEKALEKWGRLKPVLIGNTADLIITVRKGNGKIVQPTVSGEPTNDRPVVVQPSDTGIHIGAQQGVLRIRGRLRRRIRHLGWGARSERRKTRFWFIGAEWEAIRLNGRRFGGSWRRMDCGRRTCRRWQSFAKRWTPR